jgi:hypothetical protein
MNLYYIDQKKIVIKLVLWYNFIKKKKKIIMWIKKKLLKLDFFMTDVGVIQCWQNWPFLAPVDNIWMSKFFDWFEITKMLYFFDTGLLTLVFRMCANSPKLPYFMVLW